ncbi:hypothetical protein F4820DRAFT_264620 [Hypoxylon rubiginosum]|uniref:Uncharacterized protein n=1 Tax=Hypoxylon rubiginosum TaxID=110542 RepID=A0ACB9Z3H4_9PEZI|nr:hypothetical protein F4820DRAFT_264620 [Hypoxylon rubiginosum]
MTIDCLKALVTNVPDWLKRLDELNGQIDQRQQDLAMLPENQLQSSARSMRNVGSTESLKPRDEGPGIPDEGRASTPPPAARNSTSQQGGAEAPSSPVSEPKSKTSLQRQTNEVKATAQRRARATLRRRQKTDSMVSNENTVQRYRSRNMIIVYYDSYVQSFFEELVKFVSIQRNSMRKAKMAAKVAQIKRLAELEMPDEDDDDDAGGGSDELKPRDDHIAADADAIAPKPKNDGPEELRLRFMSTRQLGSRNLAMGRLNMRGTRSGLTGRLGSFQDKGDIWEELDRGLEFVQGLCERGAHQFLRDGDCSDEVGKIKTRLAQTKEMADKELARILAENPSGEVPAEPVQSRSYRPTTMRRSTGPSPPKSPPQRNAVEVEDEGIQDMDGIQPAHGSAKQPDGPSS